MTDLPHAVILAPNLNADIIRLTIEDRGWSIDDRTKGRFPSILDLQSSIFDLLSSIPVLLFRSASCAVTNRLI
jgi:hypothetical protein